MHHVPPAIHNHLGTDKTRLERHCPSQQHFSRCPSHHSSYYCQYPSLSSHPLPPPMLLLSSLLPLILSSLLSEPLPTLTSSLSSTSFRVTSTSFRVTSTSFRVTPTSFQVTSTLVPSPVTPTAPLTTAPAPSPLPSESITFTSISSSNTVSSPLVPTTTSAAGTNSPQSPQTITAIVGGTAGAVTLLAFLVVVVVRRRSKQKLSVTPFNLLSIVEPTWVESQACRLKSQSASGAVRPSRGPPFVQYSDTYLEDYSGNISLSDTSADRISSHLPNDYDASVSTIYMLQLERPRGLDGLYPIAYPSHIHTPDHYCHHNEEIWFDQMVTMGCSREPSEELPAYPRSAKSLKSREADRDNRDGFPSSYP
ncbi:hypothetical protein EDB19DRAFT_1691701 [Suillus lakei]|nr:hypothetical protein EDB19DRAFT_1691701 [Suillus lakei]